MREHLLGEEAQARPAQLGRHPAHERVQRHEAVPARDANPHWAATRREVSRNVVGMFRELGMVGPVSGRIWQAAHLG